MRSIFEFRNRLIGEYASFSRSFVNAEYDAGRFWPEPLVQINPNFKRAQTVAQLVAEELLHPGCVPDLFYFDPKSTVPGARHVQRTHPLVSLLADTLLEDSLSGAEHPLAARCAATVTNAVATGHIRTTLDFLASQTPNLENLARERAEALLADHRRVREAARDIGSYEVTPCLPVDVLGVYVLLPASL